MANTDSFIADEDFRRLLDRMTTREGNALLWHGCTSVEHVRELAASGGIRDLPNIGKKSERAILDALDMAPDADAPRFVGEVLTPGEPTRAVIEPVPTARWLCFVGTHRHRSREAAEKCIAIQPATPGSRAKPDADWIRRREVLVRIIGGDTLAEIGHDLGVSASRAGELARAAQRRVARDRPAELAYIEEPRYQSIKAVRENADAWLSAIAKVQPSED